MTVFPRTAEFDGRRLVAVGGIAVTDLAERFGTPLYVVDRAELVGRMRAYREAFGPDVAVTYGGKALCVVGVLQTVAAEGLHLDVASGGELHTAARARFPMARVVFHGNNKASEELRYAAQLGVGRVVVDSLSELQRLAEVGKASDYTFDVLLRVTPGVRPDTHASIATGQDDTKFGLTLSAGLAHEAVARALALDRVRLRGAHCHIGSQITVTAGFDAAADRMLSFLAEVRGEHGVELRELNLGGGLGIAYRDADVTLEIGEYAGAVMAAVARGAQAHGLAMPKLSVEPGRSIAGPAGITLYRVGTVKHIPGTRTYVSVDGGMSDNLRPALYGARYTVCSAGEPVAAEVATAPVTVVGKHCETGDVLARDVWLPGDLAEGDLIAFAATGAYGYAMASNYNRLPRPAMVLVGQGRADVLVRRETLDDVVALDVVLSDGDHGC
ncbi:MAG: diaminopimelate decarboxylase [Egibacteraceae bacterium]